MSAEEVEVSCEVPDVPPDVCPWCKSPANWNRRGLYDCPDCWGRYLVNEHGDAIEVGCSIECTACKREFPQQRVGTNHCPFCLQPSEQGEFGPLNDTCWTCLCCGQQVVSNKWGAVSCPSCKSEYMVTRIGKITSTRRVRVQCPIWAETDDKHSFLAPPESTMVCPECTAKVSIDWNGAVIKVHSVECPNAIYDFDGRGGVNKRVSCGAILPLDRFGEIACDACGVQFEVDAHGNNIAPVVEFQCPYCVAEELHSGGCPDPFDPYKRPGIWRIQGRGKVWCGWGHSLVISKQGEVENLTEIEHELGLKYDECPACGESDFMLEECAHCHTEIRWDPDGTIRWDRLWKANCRNCRSPYYCDGYHTAWPKRCRVCGDRLVSIGTDEATGEEAEELTQISDLAYYDELVAVRPAEARCPVCKICRIEKRTECCEECKRHVPLDDTGHVRFRSIKRADCDNCREPHYFIEGKTSWEKCTRCGEPLELGNT